MILGRGPQGKQRSPNNLYQSWTDAIVFLDKFCDFLPQMLPYALCSSVRSVGVHHKLLILLVSAMGLEPMTY
jgi:hypothetical protein